MDKKTERKNIALVAHDTRKKDLLEWVAYNASTLKQHNLWATGTTARLISEMECEHRDEQSKDIRHFSLKVTPLLSGPLGGDQQIGAMIAEGKIDLLIFFCDNLAVQGHQNDVSALSRLASLYNIGFATNRTTADLILTSPLFIDDSYKRIIPDAIEQYRNREIGKE